MERKHVEGRKRGRPRCWRDAEAKRRHHREQYAEQRRLMLELIDAARSTRWGSAELHQRIQLGDDTEVLRALRDHYRSRHWCQNRVAGVEEGGPSTTE